MGRAQCGRLITWTTSTRLAYQPSLLEIAHCDSDGRCGDTRREMSGENAEVIRGAVEAWNAADMDRLRTFYGLVSSFVR